MRLMIAIMAAAVALNGCELLETKKIDYKSAGKAPPLEVPPDLTAPTGDNRYAIPDVGRTGSATYSAYSKDRAERPAANTVLLPEQDKARIERSGTQRWLVVSATPEQVWPVVKDFWQETGFIINLESKETGVLETDWAENRAKIPQDAIRRTLGKVIEGLYSTPERDKFRTRIEKAAGGGNAPLLRSDTAGRRSPDRCRLRRSCCDRRSRTAHRCRAAVPIRRAASTAAQTSSRGRCRSDR